VVCYDARAALELLATLRPEIMLVDLSMPVMDGYDLCRHVRSLPWGDEPFIFALTGWMHVEGDAAAVGFDGCLLKPCSLDQLKALLEHPGGTSMRARGTRRGPAAVLPPNPGNVEQA
jgi:CheY-like chemotaxis protein